MQRHVEYTGSSVAAGLLKDWPAAAARFVKVMPREYRRVMQEQRLASQAPETAGPASQPVGAARG
jgi:glutamate synthase domain-containing protein 3